MLHTLHLVLVPGGCERVWLVVRWWGGSQRSGLQGNLCLLATQQCEPGRLLIMDRYSNGRLGHTSVDGSCGVLFAKMTTSKGPQSLTPLSGQQLQPLQAASQF